MLVIYIYLKEIFLRIFFLFFGVVFIYGIFTEFINEILYFFIAPYFYFTNNDSIIINNFINFFVIEHNTIVIGIFLNLLCVSMIHFVSFFLVLLYKKTIIYYFYYVIYIIVILLLVNYLIYYLLLNMYRMLIQSILESNYFIINFEVTIFNYLDDIVHIIFFYCVSLCIFLLFLILLQSNLLISYYIYSLLRVVPIFYFVYIVDNFLYLIIFMLLVEGFIFLQYLSEFIYIYSNFFFGP
jgi:hypothetical protein